MEKEFAIKIHLYIPLKEGESEESVRQRGDDLIEHIEKNDR